MQAWKARVAELRRKELRCPGCIKARKLAETTNAEPACRAHYQIRCDMAL